MTKLSVAREEPGRVARAGVRGAGAGRALAAVLRMS